MYFPPMYVNINNDKYTYCLNDNQVIDITTQINNLNKYSKNMQIIKILNTISQNNSTDEYKFKIRNWINQLFNKVQQFPNINLISYFANDQESIKLRFKFKVYQIFFDIYFNEDEDEDDDIDMMVNIFFNNNNVKNFMGNFKSTLNNSFKYLHTKNDEILSRKFDSTTLL